MSALESRSYLATLTNRSMALLTGGNCNLIGDAKACACHLPNTDLDRQGDIITRQGKLVGVKDLV